MYLSSFIVDLVSADFATLASGQAQAWHIDARAAMLVIQGRKPSSFTPRGVTGAVFEWYDL
jgi:hypothetical protein